MKKLVALAVLTAALAAVPSGSAVNGKYVRVYPPSLKFTIQDLLTGKFYEYVECKQYACNWDSKLYLTSTDAKSLGFSGVKAGQPYFLADANGKLDANTKTKVTFHLFASAQRVLTKVKVNFHMGGGVTADFLDPTTGEKVGDGFDAWWRTCNWHRA